MKTIALVIAILVGAGVEVSLAQGSWTQKADCGGTIRYDAVGFSIGNKGYIGAGYIFFTPIKDFWEFDPSTNAWTQKADFGGTPRGGAVGFSIGDKGYIGTGLDNSYMVKKDFWEYDPVTNTWAQKTNFNGTPRYEAVGFSIGDKGYLGTGFDSTNNYKSDLWEYDPLTDTWTQKGDFIGAARSNAVAFSIGGKGYIGTGYLLMNDFWEYDPTTNSWTQRADFGGAGRDGATGFSMGSRGYIGIGYSYSGNYYEDTDFWEYNPSTNTWVKKADFGGAVRSRAVGFSIGNTGYIGTGVNDFNIYDTYKDFWEYTPDSSQCATPSNLSAANITSTSAKLSWDQVSGAAGYKVRYKVEGTSNWIKKTSHDPSKNISWLSSKTTYKWQVKTYCQIASNVMSDWSASQTFTTSEFRLGDESSQLVSFQIYPNPAQDHSSIQFTLPQASHIRILVCDISGREIETVLDGNENAGEHSVPLSINHFSKGVYVVKMIGDFGIEEEKLIVQ